MFDISTYISRITAEHADKPKFVAFVTSLIQPMLDAQSLFSALLSVYDIDTAIGVQLDAVGKWVGRSRNITTPFTGVYFSLDTVGLGFDQGNWQGQFDPTTGITQLDDETYRALLKAKVIMNHWDGSIPMAALALDELFGNNPNMIISIQDNQDMTMTVALGGATPPAIILALLQGGYVPIRPEGVLINFGISSVFATALFAFDLETPLYEGFDQGAWTGAPGVAPGPVSGFALTSFTDTTASFAWISPIVGTSPFTYELQYQLGSGTSGVWTLPGQTPLTQQTITGLVSGQTYTFEVYPINAVSAGPASGPVTFTTTAGLPAQVTGLQIVGTTVSTILLSWNAVTGNNIVYQVQDRLTGVGSFVNFNGTNAAATATVTGLATATSYDFQVFAQNTSGAGPPSATVTGGTAGVTPGVIQNLAITSIGQADVALSWGQPITNNGPYTYTISYAVDVSPLTYQTFTGAVTVTSTGGTCDVTGLQSGVTYLLRVMPTNSAGSGPVSAPVTATVAQSVPSAPASLSVTTVTPTTVALAWTASTGAVASYQPEIAAGGTNTFANVGSTVTTLTATVTGLLSGRTYNFRVHALNAANQSGASSPVAPATTTGVAPGQTTNLIATSATNTTVSLSWSAPATGTPNFTSQVQYGLPGATLTNYGAPVSGNVVTVTNLQVAQAYEFQVYAINDFGVGTPSPLLSTSTTGTTGSVVTWSPTDHTADIVLSNGNLTATSVTPPVSGVTAGSITASSLSLSWATPSSVGNYAIRGSSSVNAGKVYVEYTLTDLTPDFAVGIANATWGTPGTPGVTSIVLGSATSSSLTINWTAANPTMGTAPALGTDTNGLGIYPATIAKGAQLNGVTLVSGGVADVTGDTVSCAFDFGAKLCWFSTNSMRTQLGASAWNGSGTASPANGTGGLSMAALALGPYFCAFGDLEGSSSCTINTGASSFVLGLPVGFSPWGGGGTVSVLPPGAVNGFVAGTPTSSSVPLTWGQPTTGSPATAYQVNYRKTSTTQWYNGPLVTQTSAVVINLLSSVKYDFQVIASNSAGVGPASALVSATTVAATSAVLTYRGLNIRGADLTTINGLPAVYPHANALVIPVFCSTASQVSTDVTLTVTLATVGAWIDTANSLGYEVFLAVYVLPRDGSPMQTITPGTSLAGVVTFMANLQTMCTQVAQLGQQHGAVGMFAGVELQPWAGVASGDTGPFNSTHVAQWESIYLACKAIWPAGMITYAALQTSLGFVVPNSPWSVDWTFWDAIGVDLYPGSNNAYTLTSDFQTFFDNSVDPDPNTQSSVGQIPLITALVNYSNSVGRKLIICQCGIVPADGNQIGPGQAHVIPPPYDYAMQSAWWQAIMNEVTNHVANLAGFFAWDGGVNGFSSPYNGIDYWGIQTTPSAATVDNGFAGLTGVTQTLTAPTNLLVTATTLSTISVSWTGIAGSNIAYVVQYSVHGANTFSSLSPTNATSNTITGLNSATGYDIKVYGQQGTAIGPASTIVLGTTAGTVPHSITITNPGQKTANTAFTVSGTLVGYTAAPTLSYVDDPNVPGVPNITDSVTQSSITLNWGSVAGIASLPFPSGAVVSATAFSFSHPGLPAGTHNLDVTDGAIIASTTYTVAAPQVVPPVTGIVEVSATTSSLSISWTAA